MSQKFVGNKKKYYLQSIMKFMARCHLFGCCPGPLRYNSIRTSMCNIDGSDYITPQATGSRTSPNNNICYTFVWRSFRSWFKSTKRDPVATVIIGWHVTLRYWIRLNLQCVWIDYNCFKCDSFYQFVIRPTGWIAMWSDWNNYGTDG